MARLTQRLKRQAVTVAFYLQGVSLAWRTSPALVHANDYNTMWIGVAAKLLRGSRLIYDSHELWADRNGRPEWRPWLLACEALFVRLSDATITASPGYAMAIASRYRVPAPIVIRNIPVAGQSSGASPRARDSGLAVYLGGLMPGRGLEQAIEVGWWLEHLDRDARVSAKLHGLELLPERAVAARARVPGAAITVGDERGLPFEPQGFDVVTMFTILSSLSSIAAAEATLSEARRVLRPGGVMLVWEPRLPTPLNRHTLRIKDHLLRGTLTGARVQARTITVMPPLARRLGARTERLYPRLAQVPALRTHRLTCARIP